MKMPFFSKPAEAPEEHRISMPGLEIAITHTLKIVWVVDQTGSTDSYALEMLEKRVNEMGYFMHCVSVLPEVPAPKE